MSERSGIAALALVTLVAIASSACGPGSEDDRSGADRGSRARPDIVFITLCTFRYSHMGAAGYERDTTPFLDSLAASGIFFENAVSASSWTKPATASLLTGLTPNVHRMTDYYGREKGGTRALEKRILDDRIVTLAETLRAAGYATVARINNVHISEHFNLVQGFDDVISTEELDAPRMVEELARLAREIPADQPLLFFLMSRDPHVTYDPDYAWYERFDRGERTLSPGEYRSYPRALRKQVSALVEADAALPPELLERYVDLYDAELAQQDAALSAIPAALEAAGRLDRAIFVVTADHGERFYEHGYIGHGGRLDEASVHIPLIFAGPGLREVPGAAPLPRRVSDVVRSIDVYPTIAALGRAGVPEALTGRNLLAASHPTEPESAFASVDEVEHLVREGSYHLYHRRGGEVELFDVEHDRGETRDLAGAEPLVVERLGKRLDGWLERERSMRESVAGGERRVLPGEAVEQLRRLGYIE